MFDFDPSGPCSWRLVTLERSSSNAWSSRSTRDELNGTRGRSNAPAASLFPYSSPQFSDTHIALALSRSRRIVQTSNATSTATIKTKPSPLSKSSNTSCGFHQHIWLHILKWHLCGPDPHPTPVERTFGLCLWHFLWTALTPFVLVSGSNISNTPRCRKNSRKNNDTLPRRERERVEINPLQVSRP